ncbi:MAG: CsiV family protein [Pseudomonas sp.]
MKSVIRPLQLALLLLLTFTAALTQAQSAYQVEVVIFTQPSAQITGGSPPGFNWADQAIDLDSTARSDVRRLDSSRHSLGSDASKLSAQGYQVLLHQAWVQPEDASLAVAVHEGQEFDSQYPVQALVSLGRERLLEVDVSAWINSETASGVVTDQLRQKRRLRLNETHYLDHQSMGMLIRVSRS